LPLWQYKTKITHKYKSNNNNGQTSASQVNTKNPQEQLKDERQSGHKVNFTSSGQKDAIFPEPTGIGQFKVHAKQGICLVPLLCMDYNQIQSAQEN